ncbi:MAG: BON domain-containing protein [Anaerolineae bacterium]|nr:BON domain-containing protein [Anaerolineae bacterium]
MSEGARPALDILEDIEAIIRTYPPLRESRPHLTIDVSDSGVVTFRGNVRSGVMRRVLIDSTMQVPGVTGVVDDELHDDDALEIAIAQQMPPRVYVTSVNGVVVLSGGLRDPAAAEEAVRAAQAIPGVRAVTTDFYALRAREPAAVG